MVLGILSLRLKESQVGPASTWGPPFQGRVDNGGAQDRFDPDNKKTPTTGVFVTFRHDVLLQLEFNRIRYPDGDGASILYRRLVDILIGCLQRGFIEADIGP